MIITLTRTGGFTGIPLKKTIDTSKIDPEKAKNIENRIKNYELRIKGINPQSSQKLNPDQFSYTISIQNETITSEFKISENTPDEDMKALITYLQNI